MTNRNDTDCNTAKIVGGTMRFRQYGAMFFYGFSKNRWVILIGIGITVLWVADFFWDVNWLESVKDNWNDDSQSLVGWSTLLVAVSVWLSGIRRG